MAGRGMIIQAIDGALRLDLRGANRRKQRSTEYSCDAVYRSADRQYGWINGGHIVDAFEKKVTKMGLKVNSTREFLDVPREKRQMARAIWLEWTKLMIQEGQV